LSLADRIGDDARVKPGANGTIRVSSAPVILAGIGRSCHQRAQAATHQQRLGSRTSLCNDPTRKER
jgi:hypothetical protein